MTNTATTTAAATQTETNVHQLMNAIVSNLAVSGQPMPSAGVIRVEAALRTVFAYRDAEIAKLRAELDRVRRAYDLAQDRLSHADRKSSGMMHHDIQELCEAMGAALRGE